MEKLTDREKTDLMIEELSDATLFNSSGIISERIKLLFQGLYIKTRIIEKSLLELNNKINQNNPEVELHNNILKIQSQWIEHLKQEIYNLKKDLKNMSKVESIKKENISEEPKKEFSFD